MVKNGVWQWLVIARKECFLCVSGMAEPSILPGHSCLILVVQLKQLFNCDSLDMIDSVLLECLNKIVFNGVFVQIDKVELLLRWHSKVDRSGWDGCVDLWNSILAAFSVLL